MGLEELRGASDLQPAGAPLSCSPSPPGRPQDAWMSIFPNGHFIFLSMLHREHR